MNGANLFGVSLTLFALMFAMELTGNKALPFVVGGFVYFIAAFLAFIFPRLSGE